MKRQNKEGPPVLGALPKPRLIRQAKFAELAGATGVAVLDTRPWDQYRAAHLPGALFTPLNRQFNTLAGSYVPEGMAIYLIVEEHRLHEAIVDLLHVGLDNIVGYATPHMFFEHVGAKGAAATIDELTADTMADAMTDGAFLLDVRGASEIAQTGRVSGAHNIAHTRLLARIEEVPKNRPVVVQCQTGARSAYACGLLDRLGYRATNVAGGLDAWVASGGTLERAGA
jgi:hydroxyacylglutathione hydrolase